MRRVLRRFERQSLVYDLTIGGHTIGTTSEHPFFVRGKGWTPAKELQPGDEVRLLTPGWQRVESNVDTGRTETVYNLEIEGDHTYFVGDLTWGWQVWAHNTGEGCNPAVIRAIIIGRGMPAIKAAAGALKEKGVIAKWYQAWQKNFPLATKEQLAAALARNERWLRAKIKAGYKIFDIGIDPTRPTKSPFYQLERRIIREMGVAVTKIKRLP